MTASPLRESACHEAGHVLLCLTLDGPELEFARAASSGRGTSRLRNAKDLAPRLAACIAVAGRVSEQVLLGLPTRPLPDNDQYLLTWALQQLGETVTEADIRAEVNDMLRTSYGALTAIADTLATNADTDVPRDVLAEAVGAALGSAGPDCG